MSDEPDIEAVTVVVVGIDALDPELVNPDTHPQLTLASYKSIETIVSAKGEPSTHELWPTIITGLHPDEHGLQLDDGVAWSNPALRVGRDIGQYVLPSKVRTKIGAWLLNQTDQDAFRTPATYYADNDLETVFDGIEAATIGIPNYVVEPDKEDREHQLRRSMGELFERDANSPGGHRSSDPSAFFEQCLEMAMVRLARVRRAVRSGRYELVFGYTSALDLIGHIAYNRPTMFDAAYAEFDDLVGEVVADLHEGDELILISDHGLQNGVHTHEAMIASTNSELIGDVESVLDVRGAIESELGDGDHTPDGRVFEGEGDEDQQAAVQNQLEDLGYL